MEFSKKFHIEYTQNIYSNKDFNNIIMRSSEKVISFPGTQKIILFPTKRCQNENFCRMLFKTLFNQKEGAYYVALYFAE